MVAGKAMTATVAPASVDGAAVVLQRKFPDVPWRVADSTPAGHDRRAGARRADLAVRLLQLSRRRAWSDGTVVSAGDPVKVSVAPPYNPAGNASSHSFMSSPRWLWDSCGGPITWKFSPGQRAHGRAEAGQGSLRPGARRDRARLRYLGTTDVTPKPGGAPASGADVVVGWIGQAAFTDEYGGAVGVGGAAYFLDYRLANGDRVNRAAQGGVVLNAGYNDDLANGFGSGFTWGDVLMHEIGHVIGLGHVGRDGAADVPQHHARRRPLRRRRPERLPQGGRHLRVPRSATTHGRAPVRSACRSPTDRTSATGRDAKQPGPW